MAYAATALQLRTLTSSSALRSRFVRHLTSAPEGETSALFSAATRLKSEVLRASLSDTKQQEPLTVEQGSVQGDWSAVRGQAATVSSWPAHPLEPPERLALSEALASRPSDIGLSEARQGFAFCSLFKSLLNVNSEDEILGVRSEGTARCAVVAAADKSSLTAATSECVALLLRGHAVTLMAPPGEALDAAKSIVEPFPPSLLQAVESARFIEMPQVVHALKTIGGPPDAEMWRERAPPLEFGGLYAQANSWRSFGMTNSVDSLSLARTDMQALSRQPRSKRELSEEAADLATLLSTQPAAEVPCAPGLPPPRWSRSAYDRGIEEIHDFLDLLWAFRSPLKMSEEEATVMGLAPARKDFILTTAGRTEVPEELVKAAILSSMSPFHEPVTLHAVGLGPRGLSKDPLRGFSRLVTSGRSGLSWKLKEHDSWTDFFEWLEREPLEDQSPNIFGELRGSEERLRRLAAAAGGVAWGRLFEADPLAQLRRWAKPVELKESGKTLPWLRTDNEHLMKAEVVRPAPVESD
eukprot:TRINITY_DN50467_c0_g1_i1.p1 TRINITY_DN50467_c0_g1~~TRINITY_DN50467_c0_g1_i1.p1  ORF type:complete len:538 (+),score=105.50 TRINITY_DN50467_c0_g1_i1:44-1615(+)